MTTYYKATRTDSTDFYTGTIHYEVGKRVRPAPHTGNRKICGPGLLHAADVPAETLIGGSWLCRLFEVTGNPVAGFDTRHPHKGGFKQLQVMRELPAHLALGPNGQKVAAIITQAEQLTHEQVVSLSAARAAARDAARAAAWATGRDAARDAAWAAGRDAGRDAAWDAARDAAWAAGRAAGRDAAWDAAWDAGRAAARDAAWAAGRDAARDAAGDAARGTVVKDLITPEQYRVLTAPWIEVMGPIEATT